MARIVLVADDSPTIQKRALGILKGEGYEVETVSNGVAAIKRLGALHPVMVLADVSMPGRDGYEVCDFVKKSAELARVPVLLVASDMEPYDEARGAQVKADGIIKKPFEAHELISMVAKFADKSETETPTLAAPVAPPVPPPPPEYALAHDSLEETMLAPQPPHHDFSGVSEGVAFAEPAHEEPSGYSMQPAAEMEMTYSPPAGDLEIPLGARHTDEFADMFAAPEPAKTPTAEIPLVIDEATASVVSYGAPHEHPHSDEHQRSYLEGLEAPSAASEPVFIEEPAAPVKAPPPPEPQFRTMIFRAPLEIAEPVWKDETELAAPEHEHAHPHEHEPMAPSASVSPAEVELAPFAETAKSPLEIPSDLTAEPPYVSPSMTATSLDSFSLDDAAAGQVQFASAVAELAEMPVRATPLDEAPTLEIPLPEPAVEPAPAANDFSEVPLEAAMELPGVEAAEPAEAAPDIEPGPAEPRAHEAPMVGEVPLLAEAAPVLEAAPVEHAPGVTKAPAVAEAVAEAPVMAEAPAAAEVPAEPAPAGPVLDWALLYSVVHKTVVRMSPPVLPPEVVDELARRLAGEIAEEISAESSQPRG